MYTRTITDQNSDYTATITTTVEPAPLAPMNKWEKGAQVVIISLDGVEIERLLMFPAKGETLAGLLAAHGYTS